MASSRPDWDELQRGIRGQVALPVSAAYERARPPFIAGLEDLQPQAVVCCAAPEDVAQALAFARRRGLEVAVRSGGHCFAGFSSTRGVVIDVTPMHSVTVAGGLARVGAGARLGDLYGRLLEHGVTVPAGTCPSVGIGGLTLGGGHGILGRVYGLTLDHLLEAEVVLADGVVAVCDEHHHSDLFWALRGAGAGNFGVVTSLTFRPRPAPASIANFHLAWPHQEAAAVVAARQQWAPGGPVELAADLELAAIGDLATAPTTAVYGAVLGTRRDADRLLDELTTLVGADPLSRVCTELSYRDTVSFQAVPGTANGQAKQAPPSGRRHRFTKSEFFDQPLPGQAIASLAENLNQQRTPGHDRSVMFAPWGGAYNQRSSQATAFRAPRPTLPARARNHHRRQGARCGQARRPPVGHTVVGVGSSLGVGARLPQLPRSRPGRLGTRLPQRQLPPPARHQGQVRPRCRLRFQTVTAGPMTAPPARRALTERLSLETATAAASNLAGLLCTQRRPAT